MATTPVGNPYTESSDLLANFPGQSLALANRIDVVGVNPFADAAARTTAIPSPVEGQMSSLSDTDSVERYDGSAWAAIAGGKILQVVIGTLDTTDRSTSSATFVDVTGVTVTITPQKIDSEILLVATFNGRIDTSGSTWLSTQIADASNNAMSGAGDNLMGALSHGGNFATLQTLIATVSPATLSAVTYKLRFKTTSGTGTILNATMGGRMYAIEVAA